MESNPKDSGLRRSLSIAALILGGSVLLSRVMGLVREIVLAHVQGTSGMMDAYVAAFLLPELVNHFLAGGFLSVTFIPIFHKHLTKGDSASAWRTCSNLLTVGTVVLSVLVLVGMVYTDDLLALVERTKVLFGAEPSLSRDPEWIAITVRLTRIALPAQVFLYCGSFLMAVQYAHKKFLLPALLPLCYNLGIILGGLVLGGWFGLGIEGFAWGVLIGAFVGGIVVQLPGCIRLGMRFTPRFDLRDPDLRRFVLLSLPFVVGMSMQFSNEFLFRISGLYLSKGALAGLNYALRIMMVLVAVFGQALAQASFPFLSQLASENKHEEMATLLNSMIRKVVSVVLPLSAVGLVLSREIVAVLYQHGEFGESSTALTAPVLQMYLAGAFAFAASMVVMRGYYAIQNTLLPMVISTLAVAVSLPLYWFFGRTMGARGIGLAASVAMIGQFGVLYTLWSLKCRSVAESGKMLFALVKTALISCAGGMLCAAILTGYHRLGIATGVSLVDNLIVLLIAGVPSLCVCFALLEFAGVQSFRETLAVLKRRGRKPIAGDQ